MVWPPGGRPPCLGAAPQETARNDWSAAKHHACQLPTGVPADCQTGGAGGLQGRRQLPVITLANCQSGEAKVRLRALRTVHQGTASCHSKRPSGESGSLPVVILVTAVLSPSLLSPFPPPGPPVGFLGNHPPQLSIHVFQPLHSL